MASHNPISRSLLITARAPSRARGSAKEELNDWRQIDRINPENGRVVTSIRDYSAMTNGPYQGMKRNMDDGKDNPKRPQGVGGVNSAHIVLRSTHDGAIVFGASRLSRRRKSDRYLMVIQRQSSPRVL
jgi:hypothetical protein